MMMLSEVTPREAFARREIELEASLLNSAVI